MLTTDLFGKKSKLICKKCGKNPTPPVYEGIECSDCGTYLCKVCQEKYKNAQNTCPFCSSSNRTNYEGIMY